VHSTRRVQTATMKRRVVVNGKMYGGHLYYPETGHCWNFAPQFTAELTPNRGSTVSSAGNTRPDSLNRPG
jgi:hypothetical protein